tara:strand:+ start:2895 stop:3569 length:675 start_codon:yes stop_codon:yes gene_type:complete
VLIKIRNSITFISIIISIICFSLCFWQIKRLHWKKDLIKNIENAYNSEPININLLKGNLINFKFKKIYSEGSFLEEKSMFLGPRTYKNKVGYNLITPFLIKNNKYILINRGWIKEKKKFENQNKNYRIEGLLKEANVKNIFTPNNSINDNLWFYINTAEMAEFTDLNFIDNVFIDLIKIDENKNLTLINSSMPKIINNHLQYSITWGILGVVFLFMNYIYIKKR